MHRRRLNLISGLLRAAAYFSDQYRDPGALPLYGRIYVPFSYILNIKQVLCSTGKMYLASHSFS